MTPTDRADAWIIAQVADGRMVAATEVLDEDTDESVCKAALKRTGGRWVWHSCPRPDDPEGLLPEFETCEGCPATPDCPECSATFVWYPPTQGPEMQPGRKEALIGLAQARDLRRGKGR